MTDEELVAAELAELAHYSGQQATAEATLLRMLPAAEAATVLRGEILASLAGASKDAGSWDRYLRLEAAVVRLRGEEPRHPYRAAPSLWHELAIGEEPPQLQYIRRGWGVWTSKDGLTRWVRVGGTPWE